MLESPPAIKNPESAESGDFLPYFPTDLERAKDGQKKFNEIFERSEILKKIAGKDKYFRDSLFFSAIGLMPERGYFGGGGFQELDTDSPRESRKFPKYLEKRFSEAIKIKKVSEFRAQLLKNWFSHHANAPEYFGDGFSDEDAEYFENIKKLLLELGIDYTRNIYEK